ncbi:MAG: phosphotriesterase [Cyclobacteriaceae bacterium]
MESRRQFIAKLATVSFCLSTQPLLKLLQERQGKVYTVNGAIRPARLGFCLTHEHVMSNFGGEMALYPDYDQDKLFAQVLPYLKRIKSLGCDTLVDCTTAYFGREVRTLQKLAQQSGLQLITNTGYYGAANDRYIPEHAYQEGADSIAQRWLQEWESGIQEAGIYPGFIKVAVDGGSLSEIDAKLFRAAALTHRQSGLTIACHTGNNPEAARQELEILREEGVSPLAWIWTHANQSERVEPLVDAARQGGWISLDGVRDNSVDLHLAYLQEMKKAGLLRQVLLSHDGNSFPRGGAIRPYEAIFTTLIPRMQKEGFSRQEIRQLTILNPQEAFTVKTRLI